MKLLKKLWKLSGNEGFVLKVAAVGTSLCTFSAITSLDNSPELNGLILLINAVIVALYLDKYLDND